MKINSTAIFALVFLSILQFARTGSAQWKPLHDFDAEITAIKFIELPGIPRIGFVGLRNGEVWRTSDGGKNWVRSNINVTFDSRVTDFCFKDTLVGWFSKFPEFDNEQGCYKTTDGGKTWFALQLPIFISGLYYNQKTKRLFAASWGADFQPDYPSIVSDDDGASWHQFAPVNLNGFAFTDSLHGIASIVGGDSYWKTSDGGINWSPTGSCNIEAWQPLAIPGTKTYYMVPDDPRQTTGIYRATDGGYVWEKVFDAPYLRQSLCTIGGSLCQLFIQTSQGFIKSTDEGFTWTNIGGPAHSDYTQFDTRFYVRGDYLYGGDSLGVLWINIQSHMPSVSLLASMALDTVTLSPINCGSLDTSIDLTNLLTCDTLQIISAEVEEDSNFYQSKLDNQSLPPGNTALLPVHIFSRHAGAFFKRLHLKLSNHGEILDTFLVMQTVRRVNLSISPEDVSLHLPEIPICNDDSGFIWFTNFGCDTLVVNTIWITDSINYSFATQKTLLIPGDSIRVSYRFNPTTTGTISSSAIIRFSTFGGDTVSRTVSILGKVSPNVIRTKLSSNSIWLPNLSSCQTVDTSITLVNTSVCEGITIDSIIGFDSLGIKLDTSIQLPLRFKPGQGITLPIKLLASEPQINRKIHIVGNNIDTLVSIGFQSSASEERLLSKPSDVSFGIITIGCDKIDTLVSIVNQSCLDLVFDSVQTNDLFKTKWLGKDSLLAGNVGQMSLSYSPSDAGPTTSEVVAYFHNKLNKGYSSKTQINSQNFLPPSLGISLRNPAREVLLEDVFSLPLILAGNVSSSQSSSSALTNFKVSVHYNTDLFTLLEAQGSLGVKLGDLTEMQNGAQFSVSLTPGIKVDQPIKIGTLNFRTHLTDTLSGSILGRSIFEVSDQICFKSADDSLGASIKVIPSCSDSIISVFMKHGNVLRILSLQPNPASGTVTVNIKGDQDHLEGQYEIVNILGELKQTGTFSGHVLTLGVSEFSTGKYFLIIHSQHSKASAPLQVVH